MAIGAAPALFRSREEAINGIAEELGSSIEYPGNSLEEELFNR